MVFKACIDLANFSSAISPLSPLLASVQVTLAFSQFS